MSAPKISSRAKHPNKTQPFVTAVQAAMEIFEDQIGSLSSDTRLKAYKILMRSYRTALTLVWDSAQHADITLILTTTHDKEMSALAEMARKLQLPTPTVQVIKEKRDVPTLEPIPGLMMAKHPSENVPNTAVCEKIRYIFSKLSDASKAYGEAADTLAEVSDQVSPETYVTFIGNNNSHYTNCCPIDNDITRNSTPTTITRRNYATQTYCHNQCHQSKSFTKPRFSMLCKVR